MAKKAWYDWLDLVIEHQDFDSWNFTYLKSLCDAFELPILSITAPEKGITKDKVNKIIKIAIETKAQVLNFYPPHITDKNMSWFFPYLVKTKRDTRKTINIQTVDQKYLLFVIPEFKNASLTEIKKITWDTSLNISSIDKSSWIDLLKALSILWNSLTNVYLNDRNWPKTWLLPGSSWWWISYLPLESFLMKLRTNWYKWYISLRVRPSEIWAWNDDKVYQNLEHAKNYYKKHFLDYK